MIHLCADNHDEICFQCDRYPTICPVCKIIEEKDKEIEKLENDLKEAQYSIDNPKTE